MNDARRHAYAQDDGERRQRQTQLAPEQALDGGAEHPLGLHRLQAVQDGDRRSARGARRRCCRRPGRRSDPRARRRAASWSPSRSSARDRRRPLAGTSAAPRPLRESRLPVGSSAKTIAGRLTRAPGRTATRCCWPPESSDGRWPSRSRRPDRARPRCRATARPAYCPPSVERQRDVLLGGQRGDQVERLEDEPDLVAPQTGSAACRSAS